MNKNECRRIVQAGLEELTEIVGIEATTSAAAGTRRVDQLFKRLQAACAKVPVMAERSAVMRFILGRHVRSTAAGWLQALEEYVNDCGLEISYETGDCNPGCASIDTLRISPHLTIAQRFRCLVFEFVFHQFTSDCEGLSNYACRKMLAKAEIVSFTVSRAVGLASRSQSKTYIVEMHGDEELIRESRCWLDDMATELLIELVERRQRQRKPKASGRRQA